MSRRSQARLDRVRRTSGEPVRPVAGRPEGSTGGLRDATARSYAVLIALILATLVAYQPAWHGGILWDDAGHLTRADLASASGLARIWFEPGVTQQYYPVVHTAFWILNGLWGHHTIGYHLVNVLLHATSAWLLWLLLRRLSVPGGLLAATIFALHPVHVESVAWITELKNVLSGVFYLSAFLFYMRWHEDHRPRTYWIAFGLFVLAVFSKTVTVTLPAAILVVLWWRHGRMALRDVRPLVPFFVLGIATGLMTVWMERTFIGAQGAEFELSVVQRTLLAGSVPWFYAWKLLWPSGLIFIYPRWTVDAGSLAWWGPAMLLAVLALAAWSVRGRTRAPLAVLLLFIGTLFPALGFFNVYPFRFSFVADHFQYLASIALITGLASFGVRPWSDPGRVSRVEIGLAVLLGVVLGSLTWQEARAYTDAETLYRTTIARNPSAWIAHNNLASLRLAGDPPRERIEESIAHLHRAIDLKPDYAEAHYNLGTALERLERRDEAIAAYERALALAPGERRILQRLAAVTHDRASAQLEQGLRFENAGQLEAAIRAYQEAARIDPARAVIHRSIGRVHQRLGQGGSAIAAYQRALQADPDSFETHNDLGVLYAQSGQIAEAVRHFRAAVSIRPDDADARQNLARAEALLRSR
jgi:protein O-mannosyl-transferase